MFRHLGTFAVLAVCLFAIVIVMGGCEKPMDGMLPPPVTPETDAPETGVAEADDVQVAKTSPPYKSEFEEIPEEEF